ncbi:MAG: thermosome subunit alpha [Halobacteriaceae archaeon]
MGGRPVFILNEDTERTRGRDAQSSNIAAGKAVAEAVRTTLGPKGMDKMLVDDTGEVVITNDGVTILDKMDIEHPAAQMLVEVAQTQEDEVGDGTTTAAVLAGQLLAKAEDLLEQDVHPTTIVQGYAEARRIATEAVEDLVLGEGVDDEQLTDVARSSMTGKGTGDIDAEALAELVVDAVRHVEVDGAVDRDAIRLHTQPGPASSATELVEGVVVDEEPVRDDMPRRVEDATILVLDGDLETREASIDAEYTIESADQLTKAIEAEERELAGYARDIADADVDVVFATGDIDDRVAAGLAAEDIVAFESMSSSDANAVAKSVGATQVGTIKDLDPADFGHAQTIRVESFGDDELAFVEGGAEAETVTLFVRGGTGHVSDELERAVGDSVDVVVAAINAGGVVPGAGASEMAMANAVRDAAAGIEGRQQLAVEAFADALDVIPRTLASNMGMDPIDALVDLRAASESEPGRAGLLAVGETGEIEDPVEAGVLDPAAVKREAVESATEASTMIIRIDDVIAAQ